MKNVNNALVERLYQDFCEAEGGVDHPVLAAWCKCEEVFGEIDFKEKTACINDLFLETIRYVVDTLQIKEGWDETEVLQPSSIQQSSTRTDLDEYLFNSFVERWCEE